MVWPFQYLVFSLIFALAYGRSWLSHVDEQSITLINLFNLFDSFWTDPVIRWSGDPVIRWSGDPVIPDIVFPGNNCSQQKFAWLQIPTIFLSHFIQAFCSARITFIKFCYSFLNNFLLFMSLVLVLHRGFYSFGSIVLTAKGQSHVRETIWTV